MFINWDPIVTIESSGVFDIKGTSFVVNYFQDVVDVVVHYNHSIKPFFCGRREKFVLVIKVDSVRIKAIVASVEAEFVNSVGYGMISKFCNRELCSLMVLFIIVVDAEVLLECLDCLFSKSIYLQVVGSREA